MKGLCAEPAGRWWLVLRSMTQPWDRFERTTKVWVRAHRSARLGRVACSKMRIFWARLQVSHFLTHFHATLSHFACTLSHFHTFTLSHFVRPAIDHTLTLSHFLTHFHTLPHFHILSHTLSHFHTFTFCLTSVRLWRVNVGRHHRASSVACEWSGAMCVCQSRLVKAIQLSF